MYIFLKKTRHIPQGQGLLETIIALGIIISGLVGVMGLTLSNQQASFDSSERVIAVNLAREGVEVIRNTRDSNWLQCAYESSVLQCSNWDASLVSGSDTTAALLFNPETNTWSIDFTADAISHSYARIWRRNSGTPGELIGTYFQSAEATPSNATLTSYKRLISLSEICTDKTISETNCSGGNPKIGIRVQSTVQWETSGKTLSVTTEERLFNWR